MVDDVDEANVLTVIINVIQELFNVVVRRNESMRKVNEEKIIYVLLKCITYTTWNNQTHFLLTIYSEKFLFDFSIQCAI